MWEILSSANKCSFRVLVFDVTFVTAINGNKGVTQYQFFFTQAAFRLINPWSHCLVLNAHNFLCKPLRWGSLSLAFYKSPPNRLYTIDYSHHLRAQMKRKLCVFLRLLTTCLFKIRTHQGNVLIRQVVWKFPKLVFCKKVIFLNAYPSLVMPKVSPSCI